VADSRFDLLARTVALSSRRQVLRGAAGVALTGVAALFGLSACGKSAGGSGGGQAGQPESVAASVIPCGGCKTAASVVSTTLQAGGTVACSVVAATAICEEGAPVCLPVAEAMCNLTQFFPRLPLASLCGANYFGLLGGAPCPSAARGGGSGSASGLSKDTPRMLATGSGVTVAPIGGTIGDDPTSAQITVPAGMVLLVTADQAIINGSPEMYQGVYAAYAASEQISLTIVHGIYELVDAADARDEFCHRLLLAEKLNWGTFNRIPLPGWADCSEQPPAAPSAPVPLAAVASEDYSGLAVKTWSIQVPPGDVLLVEGLTVQVNNQAGYHGVFAAYPANTDETVTVYDGRYKLLPADAARDEFCNRLGMIAPNGWACEVVAGLPEWDLSTCGMPSWCGTGQW